VTRSLPVVLVQKEIRVLAPIWLATVFSIVASRRLEMPLGGVSAFILGAVGLGVLSIGHEYAHRTLTTLLAQPISRSKLLLSKVAVLAFMLALLTWIAALTLLPDHALETLFGQGTTNASPAAADWRLSIILLTPVVGLSVAPWLTMMSRSAVAGLVFTLAVPAVFFIAGQIARVATSGFTIDPLAYGPALIVMMVGLLAVSLVAVVMGRSMFIGLEALDTPRAITPSTPRTSSRVATEIRSRRRHPVVLLVRKEARLHLLGLVVAVLYALVWIAMRLTRMDAFIAGQSFQAISELYGVFVAMLVGAVAGAEERAFGTTEWQILQPWAYWKQWAVKVAMVVVVAMTLGLVIPIALEAGFPLVTDTGHVGLRTLNNLFYYFGYASLLPLAIPFIALFSLYISTLCTGGLRALLLTLPLSFTLASLYRGLLFATYRIQEGLLVDLYGKPYPYLWRLPTATRDDFSMINMVQVWSATLVFACFVSLALVFAFRNSRTAERGTTIARRQLPLVATYVALAAVIGQAVPAYIEWWLLTH